MKRLRYWAVAIVLCLAGKSGMAKEVTLERVAWPTAKPCPSCITVQFGVLEMRLPLELVGRIFVPSSTSFPVHILPPGAADAKKSIVLLGRPSGSYFARYEAVGLNIVETSAEAFFDSIGQRAAPGTAIAQIRKFESITAAQAYTKATRGNAHAYWVRAKPGDSQYLHLVIEGSRDVYSFVGSITPELYSAILSHLEIKPEP